MIDVRSSAEFVVGNSRSVLINYDKLSKVAKKIYHLRYALPTAEEVCPFRASAPAQAVMWCFLLDSLNFCFWPPQTKNKWAVKDQRGDFKSGYWGLVSALKRAIRKNESWLDPVFLRKMTLSDHRKLWQGSGTLQLRQERYLALKELGNGFTDEKSAWNLLIAAKGNAIEFIDRILEKFPLFRDETNYLGHNVGFYKRGQILAMDINLSLIPWGIKAFSNLDTLTAFADYKLPQLLREEGVLTYSRGLGKRIDSFAEIPAGSPDEVEIRGSTVYAVEKLREELGELGEKVTSAQLDNILWTEAKRRGESMKPHHRTRSVFY